MRIDPRLTVTGRYMAQRDELVESGSAIINHCRYVREAERQTSRVGGVSQTLVCETHTSRSAAGP
jgi:hypothetical protein